MKPHPISFWLFAGLCLSFGRLAAAEAADGNAQLRAALRDATLQLRTAQGDLAAAQGSLAAVTAEKKELAEKYEAVRKQSATDRAASEKATAATAAQLADLKAQVAKLSATLDAVRAEGTKSAQAAQSTEEQRVKLAGQLADAQNRLADRETKNLALFVLGNEILNRYEEFSLGTALRAKEPFVGKSRARLENLVQDYQDQLANNRVQP